MPFGYGKGGGRGGFGGRGAGHRGPGHRFMDQRSENCICPSCGITVMHTHGRPCFQMVCPACGAALARQFISPAAPEKAATPTLSRRVPSIQLDLCTGCGDCVSVCPCEAISIINNEAHIDETRCTNCRACVSACPTSAIG